jgi:fatty-acyl-CoA synthase
MSNAATASIARGSTETPLIERTIGAVLSSVADERGDQVAFISRHDDVRLTYQELNSQAGQLASSLLDLGLEPGDRLGIWATNGVEWLLTQLATAKVGVILVTINPAYRAHELRHALTVSGCKALITMARFRTSNYIEMLGKLAPELAAPDRQWSLAHVHHLAALPDLRHVFVIDGPHQSPLPAFSLLLARGRRDDPRVSAVGETLSAQDPINIQFTSGTTGAPKGALLTHRNILNNAFFVGAGMRLIPGDRLCVPLPLYHTFGMVLGNLTCITHRATIVYPADYFDPLAVLQAVQNERCTALHGVPSMFIAELAHPRFDEFDLSSLRTGAMGGAPCPAEVIKQLVARMNLSEITIIYGMTETGPVSCQSATTTPLDKRVTTVGSVHPHVEIKIIGQESGTIVHRGQPGELCVRGYSVMRGYWQDDEATRHVIDEDGWMHTGDLAAMDAEGYVSIVGRITDVVIRGGENLYPTEIEDFLHQHPLIKDVAVVGVPDPRLGEELCAWVMPVAGATLNGEEVREFCTGQIAHNKIPRYVRIVDSLPMTVTGKVQKFKIREVMRADPAAAPVG